MIYGWMKSKRRLITGTISKLAKQSFQIPLQFDFQRESGYRPHVLLRSVGSVLA